MPYRISILASGIFVFAFTAAFRILGFDDVYRAVFRYWGVDVTFKPYLPFLDFHIVLAAFQCQRMGYDVFMENPCDALGRVFAYSPVWLLAAPTGLGPESTPWFGTAMGIGFICAVAWLSNPQSLRETLIFLLALMSSTCAFAVERANVDLIMFLLIVVACAVFRYGGAGRIFAYVTIFLAALLKFYPITAMGLATQEQKTRFIVITFTTCLCSIAFIYLAWNELVEMWPNVPQAWVYGDAFGSSNVFEALNHWLSKHLPGQDRAIATLMHVAHRAASLAAVALAFALYHRMRKPVVQEIPLSKETVLFIAAGFIIVFAFFAGQNVAYRGVFLLMLLPYFICLWRGAPSSNSHSHLPAAAIAVALVLLWFEFFHVNAPRLIGFDEAGPVIVLLVREPLWWLFITGVMAQLWVQMSLTPFIGQIPIFRLGGR